MSPSPGRCRWPRGRTGTWRAAFPIVREGMLGRERWAGANETLTAIEERLRAAGAVVTRAGPTNGFDLEVRGGSLGSARLLVAVEEHGAGRQLVRFRSWPHPSLGALAVAAGLAAIAPVPALAGAWSACAVLAIAAGTVVAAALKQCVAALGSTRTSLGLER